MTTHTNPSPTLKLDLPRRSFAVSLAEFNELAHAVAGEIYEDLFQHVLNLSHEEDFDLPARRWLERDELILILANPEGRSMLFEAGDIVVAQARS